MWFLGLIVGAVVGAIGGFGGAFAGALVGLFGGIAMSRKAPVVDDKWKHNVEDALHQMLRRIEALEQGRGTAPIAPAATTETSAPEATPTIAELEAAAMRPEMLAIAAAESVAQTGSVPAQPDTAPEPDRLARTPPQPKAPSDNPISRWLFGGNTLVRVGVIV